MASIASSRFDAERSTGLVGAFEFVVEADFPCRQDGMGRQRTRKAIAVDFVMRSS
jgi:hypothetical protein